MFSLRYRTDLKKVGNDHGFDAADRRVKRAQDTDGRYGNT